MKVDRSTLTEPERRAFLRLGLKVTGVYLGGSVLSLAAVSRAVAALEGVGVMTFPYKPHYAMVVRQDLCIDCELCVQACATTNDVPAYGHRITVLSRFLSEKGNRLQFMPVFCNQCNRPPCVKVCPTKATYKDTSTGIVMMNGSLCIGCGVCMAACPYNARYYNEERRAVDKCDFCFQSLLKKDLLSPSCVKACTAGALVFGDLSDPGSPVHEYVYTAKGSVWVLRPKLGTIPNVFYTNGLHEGDR